MEDSAQEECDVLCRLLDLIRPGSVAQDFKGAGIYAILAPQIHPHLLTNTAPVMTEQDMAELVEDAVRPVHLWIPVTVKDQALIGLVHPERGEAAPTLLFEALEDQRFAIDLGHPLSDLLKA
jgi:hypothetical protein